MFADGGTTPIASGEIVGEIADESGPLTLTTTPLSLGAHTLTVTDTLPGGTVVTGSPSYQVTVTAPAVVNGRATAIGPIAGGTVTENDPKPPALGGDERDEVRSITGRGCSLGKDLREFTVWVAHYRQNI